MSVVILPDIQISNELRSSISLATGNNVLARYESGRPWIIGNASHRAVAVASAPQLVAAVISGDQTGHRVLAERAANCATINSAQRVAVDVVQTDSTLIVRDEEQTCIYAPPLLTHTMFWMRVDSIPVVSDDQYVLAKLVKFEYDKQVLATRITNLEVSHPFTNLAIWRGVRSLNPGQYLAIKRHNEPQPRDWWHFPEPQQSIDAAGEQLRMALHDTLLSKTAGHRVISTDLSGGLDSTTLSFYVSELGLTQHTLFLNASDYANNDRKWASRAAREMRSFHIEVPYHDVVESMPRQVDISVQNYPEGPTPMAVTIATIPALESIIRPTGSTLHLNGHGGDALFGEVSTLVWSLFHASGGRRLRWLFRYSLMNQIPLKELLKLLFARRSFVDELAEMAEGNFECPDTGVSGHSNWIEAPHFHRGLTSQVKAEVSGIARRALNTECRQLGRSRTANQILSYIAVHGTTLRRMNYIAREVRFDSPYLDPRIVGAALSLNTVDRVMQHPTKPLLARARPDSMSIEYFQRQDKGDYTAEMFTQFQQRRRRIRELFADGSELENIGFIDRRQILRSLEEYSPDGANYGELIEFEFAECWLRSVKEEHERCIASGCSNETA